MSAPETSGTKASTPWWRRWSLTGKLAAFTVTVMALTAIVAAVLSRIGAPPWLVAAGTVLIAFPLCVIGARWFAQPAVRVVAALNDGVRSFQAGDFSLQLVVQRNDELGELLEAYNSVGEILRQERSEIAQRELLLKTVLDTSPLAIILINPADRVILGNQAARRLFASGARIQGRRFEDLLAESPVTIAEALRSGHDALVTARINDTDEVFHVTRRTFVINARQHLLCLLRHMTPQLQRQEAVIWKKVIRVISHELNNSLAPLSSLLHSARLILDSGEHTQRLPEIFDSVDQSLGRLRSFIAGYARFARLPRPQPEAVNLAGFIDHLRRLEPFSLLGEVPAATAVFDPGQLQRLLINLLHNAREAGSPAEEIAIAVELDGDSLRLTVKDRGCGMDEETIHKALLPFYSSKKTGTGLGLALCREIIEAHGGTIHLRPREGGGLAVTCRLPQAGLRE